ncbi:TM2 domain-containing protein almondex isoform X2 [Hydra vulgaris]|uniref:TM2 domain-containing protein almondex isoform X3 n=1 Tax=Hydra vulgaris TaxID=6087 RepID=UPI0006410B3F|nr:TM2 domain-containing protein almondex isoform X1 [Hydra vulgaris]XP_047129887.1 TM2 domain-containing protein almondex isoform X2 [Hydra vulgaris]
MADFGRIFCIIWVTCLDLIFLSKITVAENIELYKNIPCNQLPLTKINCSYKRDCVYGDKTVGNCTVLSNTHCLGDKAFQLLEVPCSYCYQLPKEAHDCELPVHCKSTLPKPVVVKCFISDYQHCLGSRSFLKSVKCNWKSGYHWSTAFALSVTLGGFGVDRFYLGYWKEGLGKLFSFGGLGVWTLIDIVLIGVGYIKPEDGSLYVF